MREPRSRTMVILTCATMIGLAILVQVFGAHAFAGGKKGPGPGSGSGSGDCTEPCWHSTNITQGGIDLAVQRRPCCFTPPDRVVALLPDGIYRSLDGGKNFEVTAVQPISGTPYNLAPIRCNGCGETRGKGQIYASSSVGLYRSNINNGNEDNDLAGWTAVATPKNAQNQTLPVTFVGSIVRSSGTEDVFITVDPGNPTYGGLYKRNAPNDTWTKVAPILNVVAMAPDCGSGARTFAVTRPCTGCAGGSLWISSGSQGGVGTWSALPNGTFSGPKSAAFNDIAAHCYVSPGDILMTNDDATLPTGQAVLRAPVTLATWDDVVYHDTSGTGGLSSRNRTGNIRWQSTYGSIDPGTTYNIDHLHVGALGPGDGFSSGMYTGPRFSIDWQPWFSLNNAPQSVWKWVETTDGTNAIVLTIQGPVGLAGYDVKWHYATGF